MGCGIWCIFTSQYTTSAMTKSPQGAKDRILIAAYRLLYQGGFSRVSLDAIAATAGLTKKTLYYHFESKDALVAAVLESQHAYALAQIEGWADISSSDPVEMIDTLFNSLEDWASKPKWRSSGFTRIAMELADLPGHPARTAAKHHKQSVESWLTEQLAERQVSVPPEIARQIMLLIEGCLTLILIHGEPSYARSAAEAAKQLIGNSTKNSPTTNC